MIDHAKFVNTPNMYINNNVIPTRPIVPKHNSVLPMHQSPMGHHPIHHC